MALQPLMSVGDILMLSQTAWKIGRAFTHGKRSAPPEFAEVERKANGLSEALKLLAETLHSDVSVLSRADDETKAAVRTILQSAHHTLDDLDSFVDRCQVIKKKGTNGGFVVERSWSEAVVANFKTLQWTTDGGDIVDLRNMLQMHSDTIKLTMHALQSRSLARLEKTVVPMADTIASIHGRVNGDVGTKIDDLHRIIVCIANSTPSLVAKDRAMKASGSQRDSTSTTSTLNSYREDSGTRDRLRAPPPLRPPRPSAYNTPPRALGAPRGQPAHPGNRVPVSSRSKREDSAYYSSAQPSSYSEVKRMDRDWNFESGSPVDHRSSIGEHRDEEVRVGSPQDSAYAATEPESRRVSQARRESATLPSLMKATEYDLDALPAGSGDYEEVNVSPKNKKWWRSSTGVGQLPPPALPADDRQRPNPPATPASLLSSFQRTKSDPMDDRPASRPQTAKSLGKRPSQPHTPRYTDDPQFERHLFRNAAILCDVRGKLVEHAQTKPDEADPRYNVEMVPACREARVCVIRKRENTDHGGTRVVTSVWCLSDDGKIRLQQKLSEMQETVPYCSYFDPEKVSLQSTDDPIALRFHSEQWGAMLKEEIKTNWVNYYFESENDAVAFQSAIFGRTLIGSFRTTKTTVIHEGLSGVFAFEEQFANIEMLRLWEDDGVSTPGAAGGVLALMHISSSFGEGWARWWMNNSKQQVKVKEDGPRCAKVKGIDVNVVRPPKVSSNLRDNQLKVQVQPNMPVKRVHGVRIEFKTDDERSEFVSAAKKAQLRPFTLPEL
ncbi:Hypothetical predicted protein [Lecanosticta acicola]|uniref:Fungal N-terminal domain-containing protein n=1 Tax=Lecanosticta acicola TaxID=111012 RepID=A0AAI8YSX6_9PEZI|nr:Hypothetical predicted protein [Lecanosticta acicola]